MIKRINGSAGLVAVFVGFPNIVPIFFNRVGAIFRDAHIVNLLNYTDAKIGRKTSAILDILCDGYVIELFWVVQSASQANLTFFLLHKSKLFAMFAENN